MDQKEAEKDVHIKSCCIICGCRFRADETCSVVQGKVKQALPCGQTPTCLVELDEEMYIPTTEEDYSD